MIHLENLKKQSPHTKKHKTSIYLLNTAPTIDKITDS